MAILREIFFAIIIDTFDQLREMKLEREMEERNCCFICGVERHDFDKLTTGSSHHGFADHRNITHNTLNYLYFILSIWNKSPKEDSGIETYIRDCLERGDVSWFPIGVVSEGNIAVAEEVTAESSVGPNNATHSGGGGGGHGHGHGHGHGKGGGHKKASIVVNATAADHHSVDSSANVELMEKMNAIEAQMALLMKAMNQDSHHHHHHHHHHGDHSRPASAQPSPVKGSHNQSF